MNRCQNHKRSLIASFCLCGLILSLVFTSAGAEISTAANKTAAILYYRYAGEGFLGTEQREIRLPISDSFEKALVDALISGPEINTASLSPLFPTGTQVLGVQAEGALLFVTFNERLIAAYDDEPTLLSKTYREGEGLLRRKLAMASLVNTLTENGRYHRVQVLVRAETTMNASMRLNMHYYLQDSSAIPDPLSRDESLMMSPQNAANSLLKSWHERDWIKLSQFSASREGVSESQLRTAFELSNRLLEYKVSPGSFAPDGKHATVCVDLTLSSADGKPLDKLTIPLCLKQNAAGWQADLDSLCALMEITP